MMMPELLLMPTVLKRMIISPICYKRDNNVEMVEQPLPVESDEILDTIKTDVCICADESFNNRNDIENLIGKYGAVNVKLDKTGLINAIKVCEVAQIII